MTNQTSKDIPAFPCDQIIARDAKGKMHGVEVSGSGMTLRQYAAIKLQVPDSGTDWLDEMIVKAKRDEFAAKAMQGLIAGHFSHYGHENYWSRDDIASEAYEMADAMLEARNK